MATHNSQTDGADVALPSVVPFDLPHASRLRWDLGSRVVEGKDATLSGRWEHTGRSWSLSAFEVTSETVILQMRTPTGRERFYGVARQDLTSAWPAIETATEWRRVE